MFPVGSRSGFSLKGLVAIKTGAFSSAGQPFLIRKKIARGRFSERSERRWALAVRVGACRTWAFANLSVRILKGAGGKRLTGEGERDAGIIQMQPSPPCEAKRESRATNPFSIAGFIWLDFEIRISGEDGNS